MKKLKPVPKVKNIKAFVNFQNKLETKWDI